MAEFDENSTEDYAWDDSEGWDDSESWDEEEDYSEEEEEAEEEEEEYEESEEDEEDEEEEAEEDYSEEEEEAEEDSESEEDEEEYSEEEDEESEEAEEDEEVEEDDKSPSKDSIHAALSSEDINSFEEALRGVAGSFTLSRNEITVKIPDDLVLLEFIKSSRMSTHKGLTKSIRELGQMEPIKVMKTVGYSTWEDGDQKEPYEGKKYILLDGLRRVYSMVALQMTEAIANLVSFDNPDKGSEVAILMRCIYNKHEAMAWPEVWSNIKVLDELYTLNPTIEEYLLGLKPGDVMKLKDIMGSQQKYPEIVDNLFNGKKTLDQSFSALNKARKEEDRLEEEDTTGIGEVEEASDIVDVHSKAATSGLSDDEVKDILELSNNGISDDDFGGQSDDGFDIAMSAEDYGKQDVHDRHPLDRSVRDAVMRRDDFKCVCCGTGGTVFLGCLVVHHPVPVYAGGSDKYESPVFLETANGGLKLNPANNLVTLCDSCHLTLHTLVWKQKGKVPLSRAEYDGYSAEQKERIRRLKLFVQIGVECDKKLGKNRRVTPLKHRMPGTDYNEIAANYNASPDTPENNLIGEESKVKQSEVDDEITTSVEDENPPIQQSPSTGINDEFDGDDDDEEDFSEESFSEEEDGIDWDDPSFDDED